MKMKKNHDINYNIGLDIGVASVGWCITDAKNNILKRNTKNMWGSRIFEEAQTAAKTREFRSTKRRLTRRKERINMLQSLILEDMEKYYPNFFQILRYSSLTQEDKINSEINGISFNDLSQENILNKDYYGKYPTIYHLRKELITNPEKQDLRLVYLAIHHIIKYRGNFLYEGDFSEDTQEIESKLQNVLDYVEKEFNITLSSEKEVFIEILKQKNISKATKKDELLKILDFDKDTKSIATNIVNAILGYNFEITKLFQITLSKDKVSFSSEIDNEDEIRGELKENEEIYDSLKIIYSWYILQDILNGKNYISEALVEKYKKYQKDLKTLKNIYKKYYKEEYNNMFKKYEKDNYVAYNGKSQGKTCSKCKPEEFFIRLKKKISELPDEAEEKKEVLQEIESNNFLRKLNVTENGAIPYQLHEKELKIILENQSKYYPSIAENKEKILKILSFRIPYYVGPLSKTEGKWSWVVRKKEGKIRPWDNIDEMIDKYATAEAFIKRMTNKCTYLINEDVIPRQSLLYSEFCVLNELNNIRIDGHKIEKNTKQEIIEELFKKTKKITAKRLKEFYKPKIKDEKDSIKIEGLQDGENFMSNLESYIDLVRIFGKIDESNYEMCEKIIYWITIFEEKKILKEKIKMEYSKITEEQLKEICKLKYTGWSRLSKELLLDIKAYDGDNIMQKLRNTNYNFISIINEKDFGIGKKIEEKMPLLEEKVKYDDIKSIPTSPTNKRAIWQSICIVKEIVKIMGKEPENIYIEFARSEEQKGKMKDTRIKQLLKIYQKIEQEMKQIKDYDQNIYKQLKQHQNDKALTEKMYLYYVQNGKCMYSGKVLNLDELNMYEVDHIIPQSYIKDDSLDNKVLVLKEENQRKKDNLLLNNQIIDKMSTYWKNLYENNLISSKKYYNLIKREFLQTENDMEKFVQRQLVETRQITKYVTNLLTQEYKNTNIYAIRAQLTHEFRDRFKIYKNRNVNNYHHAHDAYIISLIGNAIQEKSKLKDEYKYSSYVKKYLKEELHQKAKVNIVMKMVTQNINIDKVKECISYKDCFISRMLEEQTGEFYNQTLISPKENPTIPLKEGLDVKKYGGYSGENKAYYVIFSYIDNKRKEQCELIGIPIKEAYKIKLKKQTIEKYIKENILNKEENSDLKILVDKILKNQEYLDKNQEPMRLCSDEEIRPSKELILNNKMQELIYLMNEEKSKLTDEQLKKLNNNYEYMYQYLLNKLEKEYVIFKNILEKIKLKDINNFENEEKRSIINGLISMMSTGQGNLKVLELGDRAGRKREKSFGKDKLLEMTFIDKSITGMYERRRKIYGVEDNCNK